ncbi:MAG: PilN domain-containing protein [Sedimentisphaerales bacterium]|nr:PilN domain-containing protein [Sedimentisphaerales bacterium]
MPDVNLIPPARIARKRRNSKIRLWTVICGTYLILLGALALSAQAFWRDTDDSVINELAFTNERIEGYNISISELQKKLASIKSEVEAARVISCQPDWMKLFVLIGDELKEDVVLKNCQLIATSTKNENSSSPSAFLADRQFRLELSGFGRTQMSVSQFVLRLEQMAVFDSVELVNSRRQSFLNNEAVTFNIECRI